jgi:putative transposase
VKHLQQRFEVSERRACQIVDQPRSSQRYISTKAGKDAALMHRTVALCRKNPRYGYRRVWALLRREGWEVNKKRIHRLWREAGLMVPASTERKNDDGWELPRMAAREDGLSTWATSGATTSRWMLQRMAAD